MSGRRHPAGSGRTQASVFRATGERAFGHASQLGSMTRQLQTALVKIQQGVDTLSASQHRKTEDEEDEDAELLGGVVVEASAEAAAARAKAEMEEWREKEQRWRQARPNQKHRSRDVKIIMSQKEVKLEQDKGNSSGDDSDLEEFGRPESTPSDSTGSSDRDAPDSPSPAPISRPVSRGARGHWSSIDTLEQLLASMNLDERTAMLTELNKYYLRKRGRLATDDTELDTFEEEVDGDNLKTEEDAAGVERIINDGEAALYRALRAYDMQLRQHAACPAEQPERLGQIKEQMLLREGMNMDDMEVQAAEVLAVVANLQDALNALESSAQVEGQQLNAYLHADEVLEASIKDVSDLPTRDPVVIQVVEEVSANYTQHLGSRDNSDSESPDDEDVSELIARLQRECEELRGRLAREQEWEEQVRSGAGDESVRMHGALRKRMLRRVKAAYQSRKDTTGRASMDGAKPWECYKLFDSKAEEEYEIDLFHLRAACDQTEVVIRQFQAVQSLATGAVPMLEEAVQKLVDASQQAKKNVALGALPEEEDPEEALLKDLREANDEITIKQEAEHNTQIMKLEALEQKVLNSLSAAEEKVRMLGWAVGREEEKCDIVRKEIRIQNELHAQAQARLATMPELKTSERQAQEKVMQSSLQKLEKQREVLKDRLLVLLRSSEDLLRTFKQTRSTASELAAKLRWSQLEAGELGGAEAAASQWWQVASNIAAQDYLTMKSVDKMVELLRKEENAGTRTVVNRSLTSLDMRKQHPEAPSTSDRLAALERARKLRTKRQAAAAKAAAKTKRMTTKDNLAAGMRERRQAREGELLQEAQEGQRRAEGLEDLTERICQAGAVLENRAMDLMRARGNNQGVADLRAGLHMAKDEEEEEEEEDQKVSALRDEVFVQQQEFEELLGKMRRLRTAARLGRGDVRAADLNRELLRMCRSALAGDPG